MTGPYKRLIEVDLPIKEISAHSRREKSIRHGHISTLHIWWARRPLAACRAVVLAALLPDPADPNCPSGFKKSAPAILKRFRDRVGGERVIETPGGTRKALLSFVARFSDWDVSTDPTYLETSRALVNAAYPDGRPLVVDPFAGGGAIPLEALRVGADAWACDYNPVAALLLKVVLEDIPRHGERLADEVKKWGAWVKEQVEADIGRFYPADPDGAIPIAYLWSRTVTCEGPGCGAEIPLLRQLWLIKKANRKIALRLLVDKAKKTIDFEIDEKAITVGEGTVKRGSAVCPVCNMVTPVARVRVQAKAKSGLPVRMTAVVRTYPGRQGRFYRVATDDDMKVAQAADEELRRREQEHEGPLSLVPNEPVPLMSGVFNAPIYGLTQWDRFFSPRQGLALSMFGRKVNEVNGRLLELGEDPDFARALSTCLALATDRCSDYWSTLAVWAGDFVAHTFGRQALGMIWDFAEVNPFSGATGDWHGAVTWVESACRRISEGRLDPGQSQTTDARALPLPDKSAAAVITDPPYYNAVPYADLSDYFYVWLRRSIGELYPDDFSTQTVPKDGEIAEMSGWDPLRYGHKDKSFFESQMQRALEELRRVISSEGIAVVVFAHSTTAGWEAMLRALVETRLQVTASWPIDTERSGRLRAHNSAALASSVHIVCRPRPDNAGTGSWRDVRPEIEQRVSEWLPRLSEEGIEGADAIFACLGPALEAYSRYERVETANGEVVPLSPPSEDPDAPALLPAVWGAVASQALKMIFEGPEAEGLEEDARLTALWLWTLRSALSDTTETDDAAGELVEDPEAASGSKAKSSGGLNLDYDTARKLAQALGAHLEELDNPGGVVQVSKGSARLVPVAERRKVLLSEDRAPRKGAGTLFEPLDSLGIAPFAPGATTLDRLHQAMLLFSDGRGDVLRRFLTAHPDEGMRRLARSLSALYPGTSQEKRWIDGVLAVMRQQN